MSYKSLLGMGDVIRATYLDYELRFYLLLLLMSGVSRRST